LQERERYEAEVCNRYPGYLPCKRHQRVRDNPTVRVLPVPIREALEVYEASVYVSLKEVQMVELMRDSAEAGEHAPSLNTGPDAFLPSLFAPPPAISVAAESSSSGQPSPVSESPGNKLLPIIDDTKGESWKEYVEELYVSFFASAFPIIFAVFIGDDGAYDALACFTRK
jgi:hypothetical protein